MEGGREGVEGLGARAGDHPRWEGGKGGWMGGLCSKVGMEG